MISFRASKIYLSILILLNIIACRNEQERYLAGTWHLDLSEDSRDEPFWDTLQYRLDYSRIGAGPELDWHYNHSTDTADVYVLQREASTGFEWDPFFIEIVPVDYDIWRRRVVLTPNNRQVVHLVTHHRIYTSLWGVE